MSTPETKAAERPGEAVMQSGPVIAPNSDLKTPIKAKLEPIENALIEAGLVQAADLIKSAQAESSPDQGLSEPPLDATPTTPAKGEAAQAAATPKQDKPVIRLPAVTQKALPAPDPLDIVGPDGFTPRMRLWMADPAFGELIDILAHQRPMGSRNETRMLNGHIYPLAEEIEGISMTEDRRGNIIVDIGDNAAGVLWSCHTDTVHSDNEQAHQRVLITHNGYLKLKQHSGSSCLGADDGTGVWLMIQMIRAGVPGRYIFHYGEERGCIGSRWLLENTPWVLEGMNFAIAFDRQGFTDVVTHQRGRRCCSTTFVNSIVKLLPEGYAGSPGVFTDTAIYTDVIPECTNLSVGYSGQHSSAEIQNIPHLYRLRDAMVRFDASQLVVGRDPAAQREQENREEEERARVQAQRATFWRGPPSAQAGQGTSWEAPPEFLDAIPKASKAVILAMAYDSNWHGLTDQERPVAISILGKNAKAKFGRLVSYINRRQRRIDQMSQTFGGSGTTTALSGSLGTVSLTRPGSNTYYADDGYGEDPIETFSDHIPPQPRSMLELVRLYPNEVSDVLEHEGMDVREMWGKIREMIGIGGIQ